MAGRYGYCKLLNVWLQNGGATGGGSATSVVANHGTALAARKFGTASTSTCLLQQQQDPNPTCCPSSRLRSTPCSPARCGVFGVRSHSLAPSSCAVASLSSGKQLALAHEDVSSPSFSGLTAAAAKDNGVAQIDRLAARRSRTDRAKFTPSAAAVRIQAQDHQAESEASSGQRNKQGSTAASNSNKKLKKQQQQPLMLVGNQEPAPLTKFDSVNSEAKSEAVQLAETISDDVEADDWSDRARLSYATAPASSPPPPPLAANQLPPLPRTVASDVKIRFEPQPAARLIEGKSRPHRDVTGAASGTGRMEPLLYSHERRGHNRRQQMATDEDKDYSRGSFRYDSGATFETRPTSLTRYQNSLNATAANTTTSGKRSADFNADYPSPPSRPFAQYLDKRKTDAKNAAGLRSMHQNQQQQQLSQEKPSSYYNIQETTADTTADAGTDGAAKSAVPSDTSTAPAAQEAGGNKRSAVQKRDTPKWWSEVRAFKEEKMVIRMPDPSDGSALASATTSGAGRTPSTSSAAMTDSEQAGEIDKMFVHSQYAAEKQLTAIRDQVNRDRCKRMRYAAMSGRDWVEYLARKRDGLVSRFVRPPHSVATALSSQDRGVEEESSAWYGEGSRLVFDENTGRYVPSAELQLRNSAEATFVHPPSARVPAIGAPASTAATGLLDNPSHATSSSSSSLAPLSSEAARAGVSAATDNLKKSQQQPASVTRGSSESGGSFGAFRHQRVSSPLGPFAEDECCEYGGAGRRGDGKLTLRDLGSADATPPIESCDVDAHDSSQPHHAAAPPLLADVTSRSPCRTAMNYGGEGHRAPSLPKRLSYTTTANTTQPRGRLAYNAGAMQRDFEREDDEARSSMDRSSMSPFAEDAEEDEMVAAAREEDEREMARRAAVINAAGGGVAGVAGKARRHAIIGTADPSGSRGGEMSATCVLGRKRRHYQRHRHMQQRHQAAMFSSGGQRKLPKGCPRKKLDLKCHKEEEQKGCMEPKIDRDPPLGHLVTQARHQDDSPSCCIPHGDADGGCKEPKRAECDKKKKTKKKKKKKKDTSCCAPPSAVSRLELLGRERAWSACLFPQQLTSGDCFNGGGSPVTVGDCGGVTARRMSLPPLMPSSAATCVLARKRGHYACNLQQKSWYSKGCKKDKKKRLKCIIKDKEAEKDIKPPCKEEPCCGEEMCAWSSSAAEVVTRGSLAAARVTCGDCCSAVTCGDAPWRTACLPAMATCVLARKRRFYGYPQQKSWYSKGCKKDKKKRLKCIIKDKEAEKDIKPPCKEEPCCGKKPKKAKKPKKPKKKKKKKKAKKCSSCGEESESEDECCKIPKPQKVKDECCSGGCPPPKDKCAPKKPKKPKKKKMKCRKLRPACSKKDDPPGKCCDKIEDPFGCCQSHDKAKELAKKKKDDCDF